MADVATPVATVAGGVLYGSAVAIGVPAPLALPVALLAAVGAATALSTKGRIEMRPGPIINALVMFVFAWCVGAFGGPAAAALAESYAPALSEKLPPSALAPFFALFLAAYGQSHVGPLFQRLLDAFKLNRGA